MVFKIKKQRSLARRMLFAVMAIAIAAQPIYGVISHELAANAVDGAQSVVINEVKPATGSGEKWIELYNPTDKSADLSGWRIVRGGKNWGGNDIATTISAGGFYTVDAKANSDSLPTSTGTAVELWSGTEKKGSRVDSVTYPTLAEGQSYGRTTDGSSDWKTFDAPTKNATNTAKDETSTEPTTPVTPADPLVAPTILAPANNSYTNNPAFVNQWKDVAPIGGGYDYETTYVKTDGTTVPYKDSYRAGVASNNYSIADGVVTRANNKYSPEGTYSWQVRTVAADGTASEWSPVYKVTYSTKPTPIVASISPAKGSYLSGTKHIVVTLENPGTANDVRFIINKVANDNPSNDARQRFDLKQQPDGTWAIDLDTRALADGMYRFKVEAYGPGGSSYYGNNSAWADASYSYVVDNTAPTVKVNLNRSSYIQSGSVVNSKQKPEIEASDANFDYVSIYNKDGKQVGGPWGSNGYSPRRADISFLRDGNYVIRAYDKAGNVSADFNLTIDNTAPAAPVITNSPVYVNKSQPNSQATWMHDGVDVDHFEYREYANLEAANKDDAYWTQKRGASERSQTVGQSWTTDVTLYYRVVAIDAAGNRSAPSELGKVIIDKNSPTITVKSNYVGSLDKKIFSNVSFALSDAGNGKVDKYVINGYASDFTNNKYSDANFQNIKSHLIEGKNTLVLYDEAGNSAEYDFAYNKTAYVLQDPFKSFKTLFGDSGSNFGFSDHSVEYGQYNDPNALWHGTANTEWYVVYESADGWTTTNGQIPGKTVVKIATLTTGQTIPEFTAKELGLKPGQSEDFWVHLVPVSSGFDPKVGEPYPADAAYTRAWQKVTLSVAKDTTDDGSGNGNSGNGSENGSGGGSNSSSDGTGSNTGNNGAANNNNASLQNSSANSANNSVASARNLSANGRLIAYTPTNLGTILPSNALALATNPTATPTTTATDAPSNTDQTDDSAKASTADDGDGQVLGAKDAKKWSILNLALAILTAIIALGALATWSRRDKFASRRNLVTLATVIPAIGAVVAFLITENWTLKPTIFDAWTWLMAVIFVAQIVLVAARGRKANEE